MKNVIALSIALLTLTACQGETGPKGSNGANGTIRVVTGPIKPAPGVKPVQLCPAEATHSTFPEYALCIQHKLYGVYSANGGFLVYMADGTYTSNGINASCTLTVSGCDVTH